MDNSSSTPYVIPLNNQKPKVMSLVPSDPGSRYKTRQLQVQVVGKSKMIKTVLVNILDVAKDMQVPPSYIGTFMGYEIGAQAKFDLKKPERQQAFISGEHDTKDLSIIMLKFLNEVVLCPVCGLPELLINFEQKKVMGRCRACGNNSELPITNEKFKKYIQNHPPSSNAKGGAFAGNKAGGGGSSSKSKDSSKEKKPKKSKGDNEEDSEEDSDDGVVWYTDTSEEATQKRREENVPEALDAKSIELEELAFVKVLKETTGASIFDKLKDLKSKFSLTEPEFLQRLFAGVFEDGNDLQTKVKTHQAILKNYVKNENDKLSLLKYLDKICTVVHPANASKIALAVKELYDLDLIEEELVLKWYDGADISTLAKEKMLPLITWFKEAEEESSGEEEDDDEEEDE